MEKLRVFVLVSLFYGGVRGDSEEQCVCEKDMCYSNQDLESLKERANDNIDRYDAMNYDIWVKKLNALWDFNLKPSDENNAALKAVPSPLEAPTIYVRNEMETFLPFKPFLEKDKKIDFLLYTKGIPQGKANEELTEKKLNFQNYLAQKSGKNFELCDYATKDQPDCNKIDKEAAYEVLVGDTLDPNELAYYWDQITTGSFGVFSSKNISEFFATEEQLSLETKGLNRGAQFLKNFGIDDIKEFRKSFDQLYEDIKPLYQNLHAYLRGKLREKYGDYVSTDGPIPIELTKGLQSQDWLGLWDILQPYPETPFPDVTQKMVEKGYTSQKMMDVIEDFYVSMGLPKLTPTFWEKSAFDVVPAESNALAGAIAPRSGDLRIMMDVKVNEDDLRILFHEVAHIYGDMATTNLRIDEIGPPNRGIGEAVGEVIAIMATSQKHLYQMGIADSPDVNKQVEIKALMKLALDDVVFFPFSYELASWRWDIYDTVLDNPDQEFNHNYWKLRSKFSGVKYPGECRKDGYFDAAIKSHVIYHDAYFIYSTATFFKYMILEAMCKIADQFDPNDPKKPLYNCDAYGSKEAGAKYWKFLSYGKALGYKGPLEEFTGYNSLNSKPLVNFFQPLLEWLQAENEKNGEYVGWENDNSCI